MVYSETELNDVFHALSDPTRRRMLLDLRGGERSIVELAAPFSMSLPGASKHVQVLERAKLVKRRKQGRSQICSINLRAVEEADKWLRNYLRFWDSRLVDLENELLKEKGNSHE